MQRQPTMTMRLSQDERLVTMLAGAGALAAAAWFIMRDSLHDSRRALAGPRGTPLKVTATVDAPAWDLHTVWRDPTRFAAALPPTVEVRALTDTRWVWSLSASDAPMLAAWTTQIINDEAGHLIAWKSVRPSVLASAGSVRFIPLSESRTQVILTLQYAVPSGPLGDSMARACGECGEVLLVSCLQRSAQLVRPQDDDA